MNIYSSHYPEIDILLDMGASFLYAKYYQIDSLMVVSAQAIFSTINRYYIHPSYDDALSRGDFKKFAFLKVLTFTAINSIRLKLNIISKMGLIFLTFILIASAITHIVKSIPQGKMIWIDVRKPPFIFIR